MTIQEEARRVKMGQALTDLESQLTNAKSTVTQIEQNIKNLKAEMEKDSVFKEEDITAITNKLTDLKIS